MELPPTYEDIDSWRARGFDKTTIDQARERRDLFEAGLEIVPRVEAAFKGVTLGDGIGVYEARALDDRASKEEQAAARLNDERDDWRKVPDAWVGAGYSFMDGAGLVFHLPAGLCSALKGGEGCILSLLIDEFYSSLRPRCNAVQVAVVREYLEFLLKDPYEEGDWAAIQRALSELWM